MALTPQSLFDGGTSPYAGVLGSAGIDALLKQAYLGIVNLAKKETPAWDAFGTSKLAWLGRRATLALRHRQNGSFSGMPEGGAIVEPGKSAHKECEIWAKYIYGQMSITGQAIQFSKSSAAALASALQIELDSLKDNLAFQMQRQAWGNGSGLLARATAGGLTVTCVAATGLSADTSRLREGMMVIWGTLAQLVNTAAGAADTPAGAGWISSITSDSVFVVTKTYALGADPIANDYFCCGSYSATKGYTSSYNNELSGLGLLASISSTCQGLNPTAPGTDLWWKASRLQCNAGAGNVDVKQEYLYRWMSLYKRFCGQTPDMIWGHPAMATEIFKMLYPDQRFVPLELLAGNRTLKFTYKNRDVPFEWDDMAPRNKLIACKKENVKYSWAKPLGWVLDEFTGRVLRERQGYDEGLATMGGYGQMFTDNRRTFSLLEDLNMTADFAG